MRIIDIHEATARLEELIDQAVAGEPFIISRDGQSLVKVEAVDAPNTSRRLGFLKGAFTVPDDFDRMCEDEIRAMFEGEP